MVSAREHAELDLAFLADIRGGVCYPARVALGEDRGAFRRELQELLPSLLSCIPLGTGNYGLILLIPDC